MPALEHMALPTRAAVTSAKIIPAVAWFLLGLGLCRANLGDSEAQCITRYGSESEVQEGLGYHQVGDKSAAFHVTFFKVALVVRVIFLNGRVCHESIANEDAARGLSEEQMKALLDADAAGLKWHRQHTVYRTDRTSGQTVGAEAWARGDGATARFWTSGNAASQNETGEMELSTKQYADAQAYYDKLDGND